MVVACLAALALSGPNGRVGSRLPGVTRPAPGVSRAVRARRLVHSRTVGHAPTADLATAVTLVAGHLRAGSAPQRAWSEVLAVPVAGRSPTVDELVSVLGVRRPGAGVLGARRPGAGRPGGRWRAGAVGRPSHEPASAVVAACLVADELGAPLAGVLDEIAGALAADADARADLVAALAGPRSGARVVGWLPVLGALLGAALGADPLGVLVGGGWASAAGLLGAVLLVVGHLWTRWLVARAGRAGR
jgi:tight adherence protein B